VTAARIAIGASARAFALAAALAAASSAQAAQRTFVAAGGSDANACLLAQPCRSFGAAIAQTNDGGEIVVLDSAGYGGVTITKSVSIVVPEGIHAGISVPAGSDGVVVNAPGAVVRLRGLAITGQGGASGIKFVAGAELRIERCSIAGMALAGIYATLSASALDVRDTTVDRTIGGFGVGIAVSGAGQLALDRVRVAGSSSTGILVADGTDAALRDVVVERNLGPGIVVQAGSARTVAAIGGASVFANGEEGVEVRALGSNVADATLADSAIAGNNTGLHASSGGVVVLGTSLGTATARASLVRTRASRNNGAGVYAQHAGAVAYVDDCAIEANSGYGVVAEPIANDDATLYRRGNATIEDNAGGDVSGNVQTYPGPS
jgi:hypothetical protein